MAAFHETLESLRQAAGFNSSRSFFNGNGGRAFFGCTYRQYLNVESGASAPGPRLVEKIAIGLGLASHPERARRFVMAYLRAVCASEDVVKLVVQTLGAPPEGMAQSRAPLVEAMARVNRERSVPLTTEQSELIRSNAQTYWAFTILANDRGAWDAKTLAKVLGFDARAVAAALRALGKAKILKPAAGGAWSCPDAGKVFEHPSDRLFTVGLEALRGYRRTMAEKHGGTLFRWHFFSRGSETALRQYYPFLVQSVQGAEVCSTQQKSEDSVFFEIETTVNKILPF